MLKPHEVEFLESIVTEREDDFLSTSGWAEATEDLHVVFNGNKAHSEFDKFEFPIGIHPGEMDSMLTPCEVVDVGYETFVVWDLVKRR